MEGWIIVNKGKNVKARSDFINATNQRKHLASVPASTKDDEWCH
jgi:hypothetical protein